MAASILILAAGCARKVETRTEDRKYQASFLTLFNTVSTIVGYSESEESFRTVSESIHDELLVEAAPGETEQVKTILQEEMYGAASLSVPLEIDMKVGNSWFETK